MDTIAVVAMTLVGLITGVAQVAGITPLPGDAVGDWTSTPGTYILGTYVYSPLLSQLIEPLRWFDAWQAFIIVWSVICFASAGYAFGRWSFLIVASVVPDALLGRAAENWWAGAVESLFLGNVTMPMIAALIAGVRRPGWLAVPILTKISPGLVGVLWFACRGEWRRVGVALAVTAALVTAGFVVDPSAWVAYVRFALANAGSPTDGPAIVGPPLAFRLLMGALLVAAAAHWDRPRLLPIAAAVGLIGLYGWATFMSVAMAALSPRLVRETASSRPAGTGLAFRLDRIRLGRWPRARSA